MTDTTQIPAETLAACPFCGADAELEHGSDHHGAWFNLGCSRHWGSGLVDADDGCIGGRIFYTETETPEAEAIAAWNTRAALTRRAGGDAIAPDAPQCAQSCGDPRWCTDAKACWRTNEWRDGAICARVPAGGDATPAGEVDWLKVARLAGEHGVRYRTNTALLKFLEAVAYTPKPPAGGDAGAVERLASFSKGGLFIWRTNDGSTDFNAMRRDLAAALTRAALALPAPVVEGDVEKLREEVTRLRKVAAPLWFYPADGHESDHCMWSVEEVIDYADLPPGNHVVEVNAATPLPSIWCAVRVTADEDADERYTFTPHATADAARAALSEGRSHG